MRKKGILSAIGLLVLANAFVLAGIAYNRSGSPETTIRLTERELPVAYGYGNSENTGLSLELDWFRNSASYRAPFARKLLHEKLVRLDRAKLEAIGFDCSVPLEDPRAKIHYQKMLPRKTYAVLEFQGAAWEAWLEDKQNDLADAEMRAENGKLDKEAVEAGRKEYKRELLTRSRLFVIDVANDLQMLRSQYRELGRYMILPATVRLEYHASIKGEDNKNIPANIEGVISEILNDQIHVPKQFGAWIEKILQVRGREPKGRFNNRRGHDLYPVRRPSYEVTIQIGKRAEPWITAVWEPTAEIAE